MRVLPFIDQSIVNPVIIPCNTRTKIPKIKFPHWAHFPMGLAAGRLYVNTTKEQLFKLTKIMFLGLNYQKARKYRENQIL